MEGDQFWSTVLKNYSDAFEEVIKLKQRLQVLQEQVRIIIHGIRQFL
jgi:hypothetical protein